MYFSGFEHYWKLLGQLSATKCMTKIFKHFNAEMFISLNKHAQFSATG